MVTVAAFETFFRQDTTARFSEKTTETDTYLKMSFSDLQEIVRQKVAGAKIEEAIQQVEAWAKGHDDKQLKNFISLLAGQWRTLKREEFTGKTDREQISQISNRLLNIQNVSDSDIA